jgi:hypothetical protein
MTSSRKTNLDHAKKKHRPMVEDEVIAEQLERLLTPAITNQENYYRKLGQARSDIEFTVDDGCGVNLTVARRSRSERTDKNISQRRFSVV